jgi:hypothetical protein
MAIRTRDLESIHSSSVDTVVSRAQEADHSLQQLIQSSVNTLEIFLQFHLQHLQNFTRAVQQGNEALDKQITSNTQMLDQQAQKISQIGLGMTSFANWIVMTAAIYQIVRTWSTTLANHLLVGSLWIWTLGYLFPGFSSLLTVVRADTSLEILGVLVPSMDNTMPFTSDALIGSVIVISSIFGILVLSMTLKTRSQRSKLLHHSQHHA